MRPALPHKLFHIALLALIVAGGAWLRFGHGDWDGGNQLHPDERGILFVAQDIGLPTSLDTLVPHLSPLNPFRTPEGVERPYAYGHFPLYVMVLTQWLLSEPCPLIEPICRTITTESLASRLLNISNLPRFDHLMVVGRAFSALFDTIIIVAVWLLARELFGSEHPTPGPSSCTGRGIKSGVVAAVMCAVAVLHIQNAHFGTVDTALALFATLSVWLLARYTRTQRRRDSVLAGICAGLALGCKASAVLLVFPIGATYLKINNRTASGEKTRCRLEISTSKTVWLTLLAAILTFAITNPYALLDPMPFLDGLATQAAMMSGALDWDFTRRYAGTLPLWYPIEQQARWGLGLPLTLAAYGGLVWAGRRAALDRSRILAVAVIWAAAMLAGGGVQMVKFPRYLLPLTPTLFALAGGMLTIPPNQAGDRKEHRAMEWLPGMVCLVIMVPATLYALAFEGMYRQPHPWVAASEWVYYELPAGTRIAVEQGDALPLTMILDGRLRLREKHIETCVIEPFTEPDDEVKLGQTLECLKGADFLILSSNRHYGVIPQLAERYPMTAAYYQALFDGRLGFEPSKSFDRPPTLLGWILVDDPFGQAGLTNPMGGWGDRAINLGPADESFTIYDHPLVLVFRNEKRFSIERMRSMIVLSSTLHLSD
ncbi:MAG: glycosyltransferase family 39 protein [Anaerolineae bacterium]|nr:glycosyltransferase family 39 protein [Anaerolineae bacterium]